MFREVLFWQVKTNENETAMLSNDCGRQKELTGLS